MALVEKLDALFGANTAQQLLRKAKSVSKKTNVEVLDHDGWTKTGWQNGAGDASVLWFHDDGRILALTFDHESELSLFDHRDADAQRAYLTGLPDDMRQLVASDANHDPLSTLSDAAGTVAVVTGAFWRDDHGWQIADGLKERICADASLELLDTGYGFCLRPFA